MGLQPYHILSLQAFLASHHAVFNLLAFSQRTMPLAADRAVMHEHVPVSYTHLTLPTIYSV